MKTVEQLQKLAQNPFYKMTAEEAKQLQQSDKSEEPRTSSVDEDTKKNKSTRGNASVKETGKLSKHSSDPVNRD